MRVVSWNLHGANVPGRASDEQQRRAWEYIRALDADLVLVQEAKASAAPRWDDWVFITGEPGRFRKTWDWGSVIAAKSQLALTEHVDCLDDPRLAQLYDLVLVGCLEWGGAQVVVASVHSAAVTVREWIRDYATTLHLSDDETSALSRPGCKEPPYLNDLAFAALDRTIGDSPFIVAGDWNTCRKYAGGPQFFTRAKSRGWIECHREPEEQSYFGRSSSAYQLDHAFVDERTAARGVKCEIRVTDDILALSDHAPLVADIELSS